MTETAKNKMDETDIKRRQDEKYVERLISIQKKILGGKYRCIPFTLCINIYS